MNSVFATPLLTPCLRILARCYLRLGGWRVDVEAPLPPSFVLIGAPHTSNWDFALLLAGILDRELAVKWLGKHTLFRFPFAGLMKWLGGIPVDRSRNNGLVASTVAAFAADPHLVVCIPPEGTRSKVQRWRSGFYHIALGAGVPIVPAIIDAEHRTLKVLAARRLPGLDPNREIRELQQCYRGYGGLIPDKACPIPEPD